MRLHWGGRGMPIRPEMKDRYPADWAARSRFVRFYRARNKCAVPITQYDFSEMR